MLTIALPTPQYRFNYVSPLASCQVVDQWHGFRSDPMITDDFGNGIEVCNLPLKQWLTTLLP